MELIWRTCQTERTICSRLRLLNKTKANEKVVERCGTQVTVLGNKVTAEDKALKLTSKSLLTDEIKHYKEQLLASKKKSTEKKAETE